MRPMAHASITVVKHSSAFVFTVFRETFSEYELKHYYAHIYKFYCQHDNIIFITNIPIQKSVINVGWYFSNQNLWSIVYNHKNYRIFNCRYDAVLKQEIHNKCSRNHFQKYISEKTSSEYKAVNTPYITVYTISLLSSLTLAVNDFYNIIQL